MAYLDRGRIEPWIGLACLGGLTGLHLGVNLLGHLGLSWRAGQVSLRPGLWGKSLIRNKVSLSRWGLLGLALVCLSLALGLGLALTWAGRPGVVLGGLAGFLVGLGYSLRPARLMAWGFSETAAFLAFGPLLTLGGYYALTGAVSLNAALIGLGPGFFMAAVVWVDRFPQPAGWVHLLLVLAPFAGLLVLTFRQNLGLLVLVGLAPLPLALA
ncbi:MAG: hypothetical protein JRJ59_11000, partial [Deltaproteobacteria bacterium]|nr:hypothetical protein [Deltaproteobacteria bacterium]